MKSYLLLILTGIIFSEFALSESALASKNNKTTAPTITVTKLDISDKTLKLSYEIINVCNQDVWILTGGGRTSVIAEIFMEKDNKTLLIRKRLDLPMMYTSLHNLNGRYVVLRGGETRTESVTLAVPVYPECVFWGGRQPRGLEYATRLAIEIGYYPGDLAGMIHGIVEQADRVDSKSKSRVDKLIKNYFKGPLHFNKENEILRQRDEEILIPYTDKNLKGEQVLRTIIEDLHIPYEEKTIFDMIPESIDLAPCTRIEVQYKPSMLEYFFPYTGQQSLLDAIERKSLDSIKTITVNDEEVLKAFVNDINKGRPTWGIVREISTAQVVCYHEDGRKTSFCIYNDDAAVTSERGRFVYPNSHPGLRKLMPKIRPFELRVKCAANLRNLWHRLRLYHKAVKTRPADSSVKTGVLYPVPSYWCGAIVQAFQSIYRRDEDIIAPYICPGTGEGKTHLAKSHYAMNPNCKPNSPPDTVLLFETKAGWNQHGGPGLFTFDNHNPKGGCVLLNDGTVKFIRTKEELQQLRWN